jgi:hypothetical protein
VDHTANLRKNSKISPIWEHGGERRRFDDNSMARYWRCAYCKGTATVLKVDGNGGQTTHALAAMATECERVFSAAKRILTPERNALGPKVIASAYDGGGGQVWSQGGRRRALLRRESRSRPEL